MHGQNRLEIVPDEVHDKLDKGLSHHRRCFVEVYSVNFFSLFFEAGGRRPPPFWGVHHTTATKGYLVSFKSQEL
jgi:hypothetical protein